MEDYINSIVNSSINFNPMGITLYYTMYAVGFILMMIFNLFIYYRVFHITRLRAAVYSLTAFAFAMLGLVVIGDLYNAICALKGLPPQVDKDMIGSVVFELLWIPAVYAVKYFLKLKNKKMPYINGKRVPIKTISFRDTFDFIVPGAFMMASAIKIGCFFSGCCFGIECDWGVISPKIFKTVFPIQLFESATIWLIIIVCYFIKQTKFYRRGMAAPLTAAMYIFARFCWEFLRYYDPEMRHFFLGLSLWQIFCLIVLIVLVVWLIVLYKTQPSEPMPKNYLFAKNTTNKNVKIKKK